MSESDIQKLIMEYLRIRYPDALVLRMPVQGIKRGNGRMVKNQLIGCPDLIFYLNGDLIGFEVKMPRGKVSPEQFRFHARIERAGGKVFIVRAISDVQEALGGT